MKKMQNIYIHVSRLHSQCSMLEQTECNQASLNCRGAAENHSKAVMLNVQCL